MEYNKSDMLQKLSLQLIEILTPKLQNFDYRYFNDTISEITKSLGASFFSIFENTDAIEVFKDFIRDINLDEAFKKNKRR